MLSRETKNALTNNIEKAGTLKAIREEITEKGGKTRLHILSILSRWWNPHCHTQYQFWARLFINSIFDLWIQYQDTIGEQNEYLD